MDQRCKWKPEFESCFGPVQDNEVLSRVVSSPEHISKRDGKVKLSAFPNSHFKNGLSVIRMGLLGKDHFDSIAHAISSTIQTKKEQNVPAGVMQAEARVVRSFPDLNGSQALCVHDDHQQKTDVMPVNPAHAVIIQAEDYSDEEIIRIKSELMCQVFGDLIPLDELTHPATQE